MEKKYTNFNHLLENNPAAKQFFNGLPDYVKSSIAQRGDNVCSEKSLHTYANNLLQGDD